MLGDWNAAVRTFAAAFDHQILMAGGAFDFRPERHRKPGLKQTLRR
jgi:hypothetical protein